MFDELRASTSPFEDDDDFDLDDEFEEFAEPEFEEVAAVPRVGGERPIFGLTAIQRFVLAIMLLLNVSVLGFFCLLATGRIYLTF